MRVLVVAVTLAVLAAGCITVPNDGLGGADAAPRPDPLGGLVDPFLMGDGHDHADLASHALASPTMEGLGMWDLGAAGVASVAVGEMDLLGEDHLVVAGVLNGLYVVDVSDRAKPVVVSYTPDTGFIGDVKSSESGNFVFLGVQLAGFTGVHAYNVAVPERPVLAGAWPVVGVLGQTGVGGCHMLAVHAGHLYCSPNDATVRVFEIVESPAAVALVPVGTYAPLDASSVPVVAAASHGEEFTHDMTVQDDPLTGEPVMFVSFWEYGVRVVDVKDPANPVEVGAWTGAGAEATYDGNVHTTMAGLVDGRRVVVTVPEYSQTPSITFLDATDYANMTVLGVWYPHPKERYADAGEDPSRFSAHNFQLVDGRVYMAMYHGGVWVVDAASATALGYFLPTERAGSEAPALGGVLGGGPNVWDVVLKDGHLYASDIPSGVHVLHYAGDALGDAELTSFA